MHAQAVCPFVFSETLLPILIDLFFFLAQWEAEKKEIVFNVKYRNHTHAQRFLLPALLILFWRPQIGRMIPKDNYF